MSQPTRASSHFVCTVTQLENPSVNQREIWKRWAVCAVGVAMAAIPTAENAFVNDRYHCPMYWSAAAWLAIPLIFVRFCYVSSVMACKMKRKDLTQKGAKVSKVVFTHSSMKVYKTIVPYVIAAWALNWFRINHPCS